MHHLESIGQDLEFEIIESRSPKQITITNLEQKTLGFLFYICLCGGDLMPHLHFSGFSGPIYTVQKGHKIPAPYT